MDPYTNFLLPFAKLLPFEPFLSKNAYFESIVFLIVPKDIQRKDSGKNLQHLIASIYSKYLHIFKLSILDTNTLLLVSNKKKSAILTVISVSCQLNWIEFEYFMFEMFDMDFQWKLFF